MHSNKTHSLRKISLYYDTIKYLKAPQIYWRLFYLGRSKIRSYTKHTPQLFLPHKSKKLTLKPTLTRLDSFKNNTFTFLNLSKTFPETVDWNFNEYGKLWFYNLSYFDYLLEKELAQEEGLFLIYDFIGNMKENKIGFESYPASLRIINWIKFVTQHKIRDTFIDASLYAQAKLLAENLEFHLLGNHLLENSFALLFAGVYFEDELILKKAREILVSQLNEQILQDGAHFELSPMYHQIILERLLDCVNLLRNNQLEDKELLEIISQKSSIMLGWLNLMTFKNGDIPLLNDAAFNIAPTTDELQKYALSLEIKEEKTTLANSGYRKITQGNYEIIVDFGNIGPDYIPGHAHSDTFNFVLYIDNKPFIIDTGTSTYEINQQRHTERSTSAHNTVKVDNFEQSEVWASFRVARRAYVENLQEDQNSISATHNGYKKLDVVHKRTFSFEDSKIKITDEISSKKEYTCYAYLHFHPDIKITKKKNTIKANNKEIVISGAQKIEIQNYDYAPRFNILQKAQVVIITFTKNLETEITT